MIHELVTYWLPSGILLGMVSLLGWLVYLMILSKGPKDDSR